MARRGSPHKLLCRGVVGVEEHPRSASRNTRASGVDRSPPPSLLISVMDSLGAVQSLNSGRCSLVVAFCATFMCCVPSCGLPCLVCGIIVKRTHSRTCSLISRLSCRGMRCTGAWAISQAVLRVSAWHPDVSFHVTTSSSRRPSVQMGKTNYVGFSTVGWCLLFLMRRTYRVACHAPRGLSVCLRLKYVITGNTLILLLVWTSCSVGGGGGFVVSCYFEQPTLMAMGL